MSKKELTPEQIKAIMDDDADLDSNLDESIGLEPERSMYYPPDDDDRDYLEKYGCKWDSYGFYCPLDIRDKQDNAVPEPYYLKISRGYDSYLMSVGLLQEQNNKIIFDAVTGDWSDKKPITIMSKERHRGFGNMIKGKIHEIANPLMKLGADLKRIKLFPQITEHFKVYQEQLDDVSDDADLINEQEQLLEDRRNPVLTKEEQETAYYVKVMVIENGFTGYLDPILNKIHIGDHRNIYRKTLMSLQIMRGYFSAFLMDIAQSGAGKSHENDIVFETIIPERYIEQIDNITVASFVRFADEHEYYLDRKIILFNDKGEEDGISEMKLVMAILKRLITDHKYSDYKSESKGNKWTNKKFHLKTDSVGAVISTVDNKDALKDSQIVNRSLQSRPADVDIDELLDHIGYLSFEDSYQSLDKKGAEDDLKDFGVFLMSLVNDTDIIVNPYQSIFKRYCKTANVQGDVTREFERQLALFDAYCRINKHECKKDGKYYVASQKQVNDYFSDINLENALNPIESDFLEMLMKGNSKNEPLILVDDDTLEPVHHDSSESDDQDNKVSNGSSDKDSPFILVDAGSENPYKEHMKDGKLELGDKTLYIHLNQCLNTVVEHFVTTDKTGLDRYGNDDITYDILNRQDTEQCNKQLIQWYKIKGGVSGRFPVFFRVNDIQNHYRRYKAFKNVKNVSDMMDKLVNKGYANKMGKLDGYNIYYLTINCRNLKKQALTPNDIIDAGNYMETTGFYDRKGDN